MADKKTIEPEKPELPVEPVKEKNVERYDAVEKTAEAESKKEEELIDQLAELRSKMAAGKQAAASSGSQTQLDSDIEQRKKKIIDAFVKSARAAGFDEKKVEHIMSVARRYLKKDYPDITDEIHDRIIDERNKQRGGK